MYDRAYSDQPPNGVTLLYLRYNISNGCYI